MHNFSLKYFFISAIIALTIVIGCSKKRADSLSNIAPSKKDPFIEKLIGQMTLDEKLGQMTLYSTDWESTGPTIKGGYEQDIKDGKCGALFNSHTVDFTTKLQKVAVEQSRLKIPLLFGYDVIHGYKTIFPIPLAEACSWDLTVIEKAAYVMSKEAAASGLHWTFAPMVDISREPRWGRVMEGAGEDTYLGSRIAEARVRGIQGDGFAKVDRLLACVKHFAAYGAPMGGLDYNTVDMSERMFREVYLPPYAAAVRAGAHTVMTSFNEYDGVPASANQFLLKKVLRNELGFNGFIVTDYTSINEMVKHGTAVNETEAGIQSLNAGVDMDMQGGIYQDKIKVGLTDGSITIAQIDNAVRRILTIKKMLGLFDDPYRFSNKEREKKEVFSAENNAISRDVAKRSIVLLENKGVLPLNKTIKKMLIVGPLGNDKENMTGVWSAAGEGDKCISLLEGMKANAPYSSLNIEFVKGCEIEGTDKSGFEEAIAKAKNTDVIILAIGESKEMSGEAAAKAMIRIPGVQLELLKELNKLNKPIVTVLMNGRPLILDEVAMYSDAVVEAWWLGTQAGNAIADVLYAKYNPAGKLPISFPRHEGQIPVFYSHKNTGRPFDPDSKWNSKYLDMPNTPQYAFGYGLSYTTFEISSVMVDKISFTDDQSITASVELKNTGAYDGEEVVQLYIRDLVGSVTRPVKELKGFKKVMLKSGQSTRVNFTINSKDLAFYRQDMSFGTEPGDFELFIGNSSTTTNKTKVTLVKAK